MARTRTEATTLNTVCPVCGSPIDPELPPVNLSDDSHPRVLRVCGVGCGEIVVSDVERYLIAARQSRAAHDVDGVPLVDDEAGP